MATDQAAVRLPATLREAVTAQIALTLEPPYEGLITVAVNGALMSSAWFFLPLAFGTTSSPCMAHWPSRWSSPPGCTPTCRPPTCSVRMPAGS